MEIMKKNIVIIAAVGIALYVASVAQAATRIVKNDMIEIGAPEQFRFTNDNVTFVLNLNVTNPDNTPVPIRSIFVQNYLNNNILGTTVLMKSALLYRGVNVLPLMVTIPYSQFLTLGADLATNIQGYKMVNFKIKGYLNSLGINIPLDIETIFKLPF